MIRVRVDDFPQTKGEPQHSLAAFREFHRTLSACIGGKRYLLGVIPKRCTPEDLLFLRNETDCVIGMHGTDHDEARLDRNGGNQFEPYLTAEQVRRELQECHQALSDAVGRPIRVYMPPRNVVDARTVEVLRSSPMVFRTSGPETDPIFRKGGSRVVHSEPPHEYGRTDEMWARQSHRQLLLRGDCEDTVLSLHWTWETNVGLHHMMKFLTAIPAERYGHFDE